ncbi:secreted protein, putative, partial [Ixodes scapularis]
MKNTLCAAFVFGVVVAAMLVDCDDSMEQRPVWPPYVSSRPGRSRGVGEPCAVGTDCKDGTCCVRSSYNHSRTCQNLGLHGQECSDSPIKGQVFDDHCPCTLGNCC